MLPLSTLIEVLEEYQIVKLDEGVSYDQHLLAAYIVCQGFEKMKAEGLPQAATLLAAHLVVQSWLSKDRVRWVTTYSDGASFTTELMKDAKTLDVFGRGLTMADAIINAAEKIKL